MNMAGKELELIDISQIPRKVKKVVPTLRSQLARIPPGKAAVFRGKRARTANSEFYRWKKAGLLPKDLGIESIWKDKRIVTVYILNRGKTK